jgi:proline iminopeptidase
MRASIRGTEIFFDVEGAGLVPDGPRMRERPTAFVVHGGPGSDHSGFKPGWSALADAMQLVYFDHRGQGRSLRGDPGRYTLDENVEDMEALRRHLGLGPIVSLGTSYGGMVAMALAARYPEAVSHLALMVTASHGGFIPRAMEILAERGTEEQKALTAKVWEGGFEDEGELKRFFRVMGPMYARRHNPETAEDALARAIHSVEPLNRAFRPGGVLRRFDLRPLLPRITAKTLVIAGKHDWICPPEFSEEIHRLIPGSEYVLFEESSHALRVDEPERLFATLRRFVAGG